MNSMVFIFAGLIAGALAGLFGIGGGLVMVPVLIAVLSTELPAHMIMPFALGTSLAAIVFSGSSSAFGHYKRGAIDVPLAKKVLPILIMGAIVGACFATALPRQFLVFFLVAFQLALCFYMIRKTYFSMPMESTERMQREPSLPMLGAIAMTCALTGIGGGTISVPYFRYLGLEPKKAVGTSAVLGIPIAFAAACGFIFAGLYNDVHEVNSFGYVNFLALMWMVPSVIVGAQLGALIAHRLPSKILMGLFCLFLGASAVKGIWSIVG